MLSTSFVSFLKSLSKDFTYEKRFSDRDQKVRHEIWHIDAQKKKYLVRAWGEDELKEELAKYGTGRIKEWFQKAHKIVKGNAQEKTVQDMQKRNLAKTESRHKKKLHELKSLASETKVRNVFKELADVKGL